MAASTTTIKFALSPCQAGDDVLDLSAKKGIMAYHAAIKPIPVPFDGGSREISHFQSQLKRRADTAGWNHGSGNIIDIPDENGDDQNLIMQYGCLTTDDIKTEAKTYLGKQTRQAQNNQMMMQCLLASLTEKCFGKISNDHKSYTIDGVESASLLFKLLMSTSIVDTRARTYQLCTSLDNLDNYMGTVSSNIELYNLHVRDAHEGLLARGQKIDHLVMKIFKGYKAASNNNFVEYITKKEEDFMEGKDFTADELMQLALNKYTMRKENGEWGAPSIEQEQITALSLELSKVKSANSSKKSKDKNKGGNGAKNDSKTNKKGKKVKKSNADMDEMFKWKSVPPAEGTPQTKEVFHKTYHWCVKHRAWTIHSNEECTLEVAATATSSTTTNKPKDTKIENAMQTIWDSVDSEEE